MSLPNYKSPHVGGTERYGGVSEWLLFPSNCQKHEGVFCRLHCEDRIGPLKVKFTELWEPLPPALNWAPWNFLSLDLSTWSLQQFNHPPSYWLLWRLLFQELVLLCICLAVSPR